MHFYRSSLSIIKGINVKAFARVFVYLTNVFIKKQQCMATTLI